jgi:hypothetical protein
MCNGILSDAVIRNSLPSCSYSDTGLLMSLPSPPMAYLTRYIPAFLRVAVPCRPFQTSQAPRVPKTKYFDVPESCSTSFMKLQGLSGIDVGSRTTPVVVLEFRDKSRALVCTCSRDPFLINCVDE